MMISSDLLEEIIKVDCEIDENDPDLSYLRGYVKAREEVWASIEKIIEADSEEKTRAMLNFIRNRKTPMKFDPDNVIV